jgi:hypothetical protein
MKYYAMGGVITPPISATSPRIHSIGDWVDCRAGMYAVKPVCRLKSTLDYSIVEPVAQLYEASYPGSG